MVEVRAARPPLAARGLRQTRRILRLAGCPGGDGDGPSHCALRPARAALTRRAGRGAASAALPLRSPPGSGSSSASGPGSANETGLRKAKHRRKSYLCRLLRNTTRRARAGTLPVYTSWDSVYKSDTRLINRRSLCTGQKEGAFMTTCHRLNLRKPLQWSNK